MVNTIDSAIIKWAEEIAEGLYPHQVEGIAFLMGRRRSILADDMGLGKTRRIMDVLQPQVELPKGFHKVET